MIKVKLINAEEVKDIFKNWGKTACQCYNTPEKFAERVGQACLKSGHFSGSRTEYFKFNIDGISRACSLQLNRHSIGVVLNQQSQRYVDMSRAFFVIPEQIKRNQEALKVYEKAMMDSKESYLQIQEILLKSGRNKEQANEDARYCLLESCETCGTWSFTLESLIHFMNKRLCLRSQAEIRQLANEMKKAVLEVVPELQEYLVAHCEALLYCNEDKCCGRYPKKSEVKEILKQYK